jgi:Na+/H+ antiporter NhaD/arsenite permease-like protein/CBS domain-containing protein
VSSRMKCIAVCATILLVGLLPASNSFQVPSTRAGARLTQPSSDSSYGFRKNKASSNIHQARKPTLPDYINKPRKVRSRSAESISSSSSPSLASSLPSSGTKLDAATASDTTATSAALSTKPLFYRTDPVSKILDLYTTVTVYSDESVAVTIEKMNSGGRGGALVLDRSSEELLGIFTERDFVTKILDTERPASETVVSEVMTTKEKLLYVTADQTIGECRKFMVNNRIRRLPIVDVNNQNKALGLVSMSQIVRLLEKEYNYLESAKLVGNTLAQVQEQSKIRMNQIALESGTEGEIQDILRGGLVLIVSLVGAGVLQTNWVHDHEWLAMISTFVLGYVGIVFESFFEFNKAAIALLMATALWIIYAGTAGGTGLSVADGISHLAEKISEVSEVVYFILGAMTIVEIVDAHQGFKVVTDIITAKKKRDLMWVIGIMTFFMSAILDNLTTTIVMVSLIKKVLTKPEDRKLFGAMIVIAANAGGAWTPIGDVTTTMLWINGQISALPTITDLFLPSLASVLLSIAALQTQVPADELVETSASGEQAQNTELAARGKLVFATGIAGLLSVPAFKALTGLPPYLGMLSALGVMWTLTDTLHAGEGSRQDLMAPAALRKIDTSGCLFFLGILLSVGALDSAGILSKLASVLDTAIGNDSLVATAIGFASAIVDNVPLVAATMGMYSITDVPMDSQLWQLIAFCAGTGGSLLVIGSAAGVALMGLEKVDFLWYAKKITLPALAGYLGGIAVYLAQHQVMAGGGFSLAALAESATAALSSISILP